ncbi:putative membrane protein [Burkholderia thailandensis MSMB121]|uniref:Uncharacterized protein n=2 Tax=Burkholderia humptydooensis TaxID=430531 RepID=A0A7U4SQR6_9BURK|nr:MULTISPECIES: hypothetical protein [Burkholderia]AGK48685.1 putative membrane protein [Burkholderia thailandensis MSMB121]ATF35526.1 hypothetical protein CO709_20525 [Burkholderia thailandensis]AJY43124.1 putative membrane protein [Burkholderia sp. 2002721687]ALX41185.1 hypothetical protein AQ610_01255 [Burkholderia humptydooensis]EIP89179.1 hypothetical protein A33K_12758 [Burkholderia humptydooensis MSMB43]
MTIDSGWVASTGLPAAVYWFCFGYALFRAFGPRHARYPKLMRGYAIACAGAMLFGLLAAFGVEIRAPDASALSSLGTTVTFIGIVGVLIGCMCEATVSFGKRWER